MGSETASGAGPEPAFAARLARGHALLAGAALCLLLCAGALAVLLAGHRLGSLSLIAAREAAQARQLEFQARDYVRAKNPRDREGLRDSISLLRVSHEYLAGTGADSGGGRMPASVRRIYYGAPYNLDSLIRAYIAHGEALLQMPEPDLAAANPHYDFIAGRAATLQRGLDAAAENYDFEDRRQAQRYEYFILFTLLALLGVLAAEAALVAGPLLRLALREAPGYADFSLADRLTGLDNLACIAGKGEKHIRASLRHGRPLSLCVVNLDNCGEIIGRYGPEAADSVLKSCADLLCRAIRAEDELARIDDDEFALLLPFTRLEQAHHLAERLRLLVERTALARAAQPGLFVTISIGLAELDPGLPQFDAMLAAARDALGHAKLDGRNRVCVAERKPYNIRLVSVSEQPGA
jgi:diguanylate cyclase (GGDEF)-like protein